MKHIVLMLLLGMVALVIACTQLGAIKQKPEITLAKKGSSHRINNQVFLCSVARPG